MANNLSEVLAKIGEAYKDNIQEDSRYYLEISIAQKAAELGFSEVINGISMKILPLISKRNRRF